MKTSLFVGTSFGDKKVGILMHVANKDLSYLGELVVSGTFKPIVDRQYPPHEVPEAMRCFGEGKVQGKIIITMDKHS